MLIGPHYCSCASCDLFTCSFICICLFNEHLPRVSLKDLQIYLLPIQNCLFSALLFHVKKNLVHNTPQHIIPDLRELGPVKCLHSHFFLYQSFCCSILFRRISLYLFHFHSGRQFIRYYSKHHQFVCSLLL